MVDQNRQSFQGRIGRIERVHKQGGGFEAAGALGMADFKTVPKRRRLRASLLPLCYVIAMVIGMKSVVLSGIGPDAYGERLAQLKAAGPAGEVGALVLQPDPATLYVTDLIDRALK